MPKTYTDKDYKGIFFEEPYEVMRQNGWANIWNAMRFLCRIMRHYPERRYTVMRVRRNTTKMCPDCSAP